MPSFDVVSEIDRQEVRKGTGSSVTLDDKADKIDLHSVSADRLAALRVVLEEKLVKRGVSLRSLEFGDVADAAGGTVRQTAELKPGISSDQAKKINGHIKDLKLKGVQSQTQGDQIRVTGKKRDDLQTAIGKLREHDFGVPLDFTNFRD